MNNVNVFRQFISILISKDIQADGRSFFELVALNDQVPDDDSKILHEIISCFLVLMGTETNPQYQSAQTRLSDYSEQPKWNQLVSFLDTGLKNIPGEIRQYIQENPEFENKLIAALRTFSDKQDLEDILGALRAVLFPEGIDLDGPGKREEKIASLRQKRNVHIEKLNPNPVENPAVEMVFTSNMLLTIPLTTDEDKWHLSPSLKSRAGRIMDEAQQYWYDHPIPLGTAPENNEVLYGLQGLEEMLKFEASQNNLPEEAKLTVILSASTTHNGIHPLVKDYFSYLLENAEPLSHINLHIFTEDDTEALLNEVLIPLADHFGMADSIQALRDVFGVDGEYGRHYSFLKAVTAFWQVFINPQIKATFKIDLDQVFPQQELLEQGGFSALQHFTTPLWGASGRDEQGREVELAMIAGSLVNHDDISKSLFYPDVQFPSKEKLTADGLVFYSALPQAQSTEAEMMCRYDGKNLDGSKEVIQRVHVTGGTNGILIDALRRHRPFTPSNIGRAEDQAYLLSVLFASQPALRYLHKPGLIMRHDKQIFAGDAISAAASGKKIGDYVRILLFSYYGRALPWPMEKTKDLIDPFTGCFMTAIPLTIVYLRFAFEILAKLNQGSIEAAIDFASAGAARLNKLLDWLLADDNPMKEIYDYEKSGWDLYYSILDETENAVKKEDQFVLNIKEKMQKIARNTFIHT